MAAHIHISLILWCFYHYEFSFWLFYSYHLHEDEIICVLQLVQWMRCFIIFFCIYDIICAYLFSVSLFCICVCVIVFYRICHFFYFYFCIFMKFQLNYMHKVYTYLSYIIVSYFLHIFYCTNVISCHEIFSVILLTFSSFHHHVHVCTFTW